MISNKRLIKNLINVNNIVVNDAYVYTDSCNVKHIRINIRPTKHEQNRCPYCHKKCSGYDKTNHLKIWRHLDFGGIIVEIEGYANRIECKEHGVIVANVPWAYPDSSFTKDFDMTVSWLAKYLPKSAVAEYMRIDWGTVGRCISRALNDIEPDLKNRLNNLKIIGIDETSYKKGYKYITVIVNHETNTVVWAHEGHGKEILKLFYEKLTDEQRNSIQVVTGDGARWITDCVNEYTPNCERCVDPFHVVEWAGDALDKVRTEAWQKAKITVNELSKSVRKGSGRYKKDDANFEELQEAKKIAKDIKNSSFALEKAPEHLTENQAIKLEMIASSNPKLYRAYRLKEELRLLLKMNDVELAAIELKRWRWKASHSRIDAFVELSRKIKRHEKHILNTIKLGLSNARIEANNNKIKLIIRKSYGFRNLQNMLDMVYMICSNLVIPLPNRKTKGFKTA